MDSDQRTDINCECGAKVGSRNATEVWPEKTTQVEIRGGVVFFQCSADYKYVEIGLSSAISCLHKPGMERIY